MSISCPNCESILGHRPSANAIFVPKKSGCPTNLARTATARHASSKFRISSGSSRIPKNSGGRGLGAALRNAPNSGEFGYAQLRRHASVRIKRSPGLCRCPSTSVSATRRRMRRSNKRALSDSSPYDQSVRAAIPPIIFRSNALRCSSSRGGPSPTAATLVRSCSMDFMPTTATASGSPRT